jgi:multidrug efflux pump subunit AcrA (membrane-fusion protein)
VRGVLPNSDRALFAGIFVRVRVPVDQVQNALFVPASRSAAIRPGVICWS